MQPPHAPLRLGVAGTGFIGRLHVRNAVRSEMVDLVAVASAHGSGAADIARELGPQVRPMALEDLLSSDEIEAVFVATRTSDHAKHAIEALRNGKHVLIEKPGTVTLSDHRLICDASAADPGLVVRVAYHRRHDPRFRELSALVTSGTIGEPFGVHMASREDFPPSEADHYSGGFILDVGVHDFDTARWLLGEDPASVYALTHAPVYRDAELDNVYVTIGYGRGVATTQLARTSSVGLDIRCEIVGSDGSAMLTNSSLAGGITVLTAARAHEFPADCSEGFPEAYVAELEDFALSCRGVASPGATLDDDRWAVATGVAARASAASGNALAVGPDWEWEFDAATLTAVAPTARDAVKSHDDAH